MAKNDIVQLRCTPIEKQRWNQAAQANGQELSPWIRHILNTASGYSTLPYGMPPPPDPLFPDREENE